MAHPIPPQLHATAAAQLAAEITKTETALARYFDAFETGSLDAASCGPRVKDLSERLRGLEGRQAELAPTTADLSPQA